MTKADPNTIGGRIRIVRQQLGKTASTFAEQIGITSGYLSTIERNQNFPSTRLLHKIANAANVPYIYLETGHMPKPKEPDIQSQINQLADLILHKFGPQHQATILIEEMAELTQVLCKIQRGKFDRNKLSEEYTHVAVSAQVIKILIGIQDCDIQAQIKDKLAEYTNDPA